MKLVILTLALCVPLAACNQPGATGNNTAAPATDTAAADAVKAAEDELLAGFKAKDAKRIVAAYAPDAEIMAPFAPPHGAADAAGDLKDPAFALDFTRTKTDVAASGDLAYTRGTFSITYTNPATKKPENMSGNYVTVFKKQADGSWKAVQDIATPGPAKS
jgi:ketosteroid isomerase-like protein